MQVQLFCLGCSKGPRKRQVMTDLLGEFDPLLWCGLDLDLSGDSGRGQRGLPDL